MATSSLINKRATSKLRSMVDCRFDSIARITLKRRSTENCVADDISE